MEWTTEVLNRIKPAGDPGLEAAWLAAAVVIALGCVTVPWLWRVLRIVVTLVHELGHAFVGVLCGRRFTGFVVRSDMSGEAVTVGKPSGAGLVWTTAAGYPAPAIFGLLLTAAAMSGWAPVVLTVVLVVLLISLIRIRSLLTALVMLAVMAGVAALWWWRSDAVQAEVLLGLGAFLLFGAWRQWANVARSANSGSDPARLAALTHLPRVVWLGLFFLVITACTAGAAWVVLDALPAVPWPSANR